MIEDQSMLITRDVHLPTDRVKHKPDPFGAKSLLPTHPQDTSEPAVLLHFPMLRRIKGSAFANLMHPLVCLKLALLLLLCFHSCSAVHFNLSQTIDTVVSPGQTDFIQVNDSIAFLLVADESYPSQIFIWNQTTEQFDPHQKLGQYATGAAFFTSNGNIYFVLSPWSSDIEPMYVYQYDNVTTFFNLQSTAGTPTATPVSEVVITVYRDVVYVVVSSDGMVDFYMQIFNWHPTLMRLLFYQSISIPSDATNVFNMFAHDDQLFLFVGSAWEAGYMFIKNSTSQFEQIEVINGSFLYFGSFSVQSEVLYFVDGAQLFSLSDTTYALNTWMWNASARRFDYLDQFNMTVANAINLVNSVVVDWDGMTLLPLSDEFGVKILNWNASNINYLQTLPTANSINTVTAFGFIEVNGLRLLSLMSQNTGNRNYVQLFVYNSD